VTVSERLALHFSCVPQVETAAFIAHSATILGDVQVGAESSVWYQCVLRGDINRIVIGRSTNIQDGTVIHLADEQGVLIGDFCTIGHRALIHACTIADECLIGMGAQILDGAQIGRQCLIGAGALVTKNTIIPEGQLVLGSPARVVRALSEEERKGLRYWAEKYVLVARAHADRQISSPVPQKS
jgi:gamma-carbonic anhydrase